jgi:diguanylate cyclase (GGDEF)-like protein
VVSRLVSIAYPLADVLLLAVLARLLTSPGARSASYRLLGAALLLELALLDVDHFKRFNDTHGHQAGDLLLKSAAAAWKAQLREGDMLARYGGEEFTALLVGCSQAEAVVVLERVRAATPLGETVSVGIAQWDGRQTPEQLIGLADEALYQAKHQGRNRVVAAPAPAPQPATRGAG